MDIDETYEKLHKETRELIDKRYELEEHLYRSDKVNLIIGQYPKEPGSDPYYAQTPLKRAVIEYEKLAAEHNAKIAAYELARLEGER